MRREERENLVRTRKLFNEIVSRPDHIWHTQSRQVWRRGLLVLFCICFTFVDAKMERTSNLMAFLLFLAFCGRNISHHFDRISAINCNLCGVVSLRSFQCEFGERKICFLLFLPRIALNYEKNSWKTSNRTHGYDTNRWHRLQNTHIVQCILQW